MVTPVVRRAWTVRCCDDRGVEVDVITYGPQTAAEAIARAEPTIQRLGLYLRGPRTIRHLPVSYGDAP